MIRTDDVRTPHSRVTAADGCDRTPTRSSTNQGRNALFAIGKINALSHDNRIDLRVFTDRLYKSAINSAYTRALTDEGKLDEFIRYLTFLFNKNAITRGHIGDREAQVEAVICAAQTLSDAYKKRYESPGKQPNDYRLFIAYKSVAKELSTVFQPPQDRPPRFERTRARRRRLQRTQEAKGNLFQAVADLVKNKKIEEDTLPEPQIHVESQTTCTQARLFDFDD